MKRVLKVIIAIIALSGIIGLFMPSDLYVQRTIQINSSVEKVFEQVAILPNWDNWMPWKEMDSSLVCYWNDITTGVGAYYTWTMAEGKEEGRLEIIELSANKHMKTKVEFGQAGQGNGHWHFTPNAHGVEVSWGLSMDMGANPYVKIMAPLMDAMMGPDFEKGLANIKNYCE